MSTDKTSAVLTESGCISITGMKSLADNTISEADKHLVSQHLKDCELCKHAAKSINRETITSIGSITASVNNRIVLKISQTGNIVYILKQYWYVLAAVLVIVSGISIFYRTNQVDVKPISEISINDSLLNDITLHNTTKTNHLAENNKETVSDFEDKNHEKSVVVIHQVESIETDENIPNDENKEEDEKNPSADHSENENVDITAENVDPSGPDNADQNADISSTNNSDAFNRHSDNLNNIVHISAKSTGKQSYEMMTYNGKGKRPKGMKLSEMPQYFGGDEAMEDYVSEKMKKCESIHQAANQTLRVEFRVSSKGKVEDVKLSGSVNEDLNACIKDIFLSMSLWSPGKKKGDIVCFMAVTVR